MNTIKVQIALEIDPDGNWYAYGDDKGGTWDEVAEAVDFKNTGSGSKCYWIEVEVPVPAAEPETLKGEAVAA